MSTAVADIKGGETVTVGDEKPIDEATMLSRIPCDTDAMIDPNELRIADRMLNDAGCATPTVVTSNKRSSRGDFGVIGPTPEKVNLLT